MKGMTIQTTDRARRRTVRIGDVAGMLALALALSGGGTYAYAASRPTHQTQIVSSFDEGGWVRYQEDEGTTEVLALCPSGFVVTGGGVQYDIDYAHADVSIQSSSPYHPDDATGGRQGWIGQVVWGPDARVEAHAYAVCLQRRH